MASPVSSRRALLALPLAASLATPSLAQARPVIRAGFIPVLGSAPLFLAAHAGWAEAAGLDLRLTQFESGPNMIQAVASGTLEAYVAGIGPVAVARARGVDLRVVLATAIEEMAFVATGALATELPQARPAAEGFAAFLAATGRRARLATQPPGSVPNVTLQHWLWEVEKVARDVVEIMPMGIDATQQALLARAVDGATVREPALTILADRDPSLRLAATGGRMFPNQPGGVVALTGRFLTQQPEAAGRLVEQLLRAADLLASDAGAAAPQVVQALGRGIVAEEVIRRALVSPASRFVADPLLIEASTRAMLDYQVKLGAIRQAPSLDGLFDNSLYQRARAARI
ncbi:ABC transporter substrate-binding protein [Falsiroseomonas sp.]|uniref:ABC transporter substrate-binding protein n=1 Tax=Falsiroseomonas sp. TaxID=2870721 RepID=UPI0027243356|nr:ABC transporter substrate-binding protein [Falsiroseomonas sp.]MDO9499622.1 ABC transporter substrate-binding protein [Falsiroseomonas sp.]